MAKCVRKLPVDVSDSIRSIDTCFIPTMVELGGAYVRKSCVEAVTTMLIRKYGGRRQQNGDIIVDIDEPQLLRFERSSTNQIQLV